MAENKKRLYSQTFDSQQEETALDETSSDLTTFLINHYNYSNPSSSDESNHSNPFLKYRKLSNVVIKTTFKDFYLNDFIAKRSGLLRKMIDSNSEWNLGKDEEGRFIIDLCQVQDSIVSKDEILEESDFEIIFKYLYSDKIDERICVGENGDFEQARRIVQLTKYFDMNYMLKSMLDRNSGLMEDFCRIQVKSWMEFKLTEEDYFLLLRSIEGEQPSIELANLICQESEFPFDWKCYVLIEAIKTQNGIDDINQITKEMLQPVERSIEYIKNESKRVIKGGHFFTKHKQMAEILGIQNEEIDYKSLHLINQTTQFTQYYSTYFEKEHHFELFGGGLKVSIEKAGSQSWNYFLSKNFGNQDDNVKVIFYYTVDDGKTIKKESFFSKYCRCDFDLDNEEVVFGLLVILNVHEGRKSTKNPTCFL
ncbi:predicted protein [Naegleria gruberi]|uniref:Predicted protein n=1 Tax=Naegleria gruberi TaxID=5762 RepID=D2VGS4_NAEGR|nr:uncharacterized protein NAEGRDRAFT_68080 [Naegleria gruberi]EFC44018.1 predicted protein [Naegleria gruberi]|eukprot:XP_002676762.1 predicted protein [Naegleria gruberi strain NEG-M]